MSSLWEGPEFLLSSLTPEKLYGNVDYVEERHRHRYEVNPKYVEELEQNGLKFVGRSTDQQRMEILELEGVSRLLPEEEFHDDFLASLPLPSLSSSLPPLSLPPLPFCSPDHPYFVGVQYHPEYLTRPMQPSPPYLGLVMAACNKLEGYLLRNCQLSPRASYEYDSEEDDEVTQALHKRRASKSPCPPEVVTATSLLQIQD